MHRGDLAQHPSAVRHLEAGNTPLANLPIVRFALKAGDSFSQLGRANHVSLIAG